jgi:hypothetical protein
MVRHTSTVVSVPSQADTQLSPMGVAWSTNALIACSLRMGSQEPSVRHGPIVLRWPRKRAGNAISPASKKAKQDGGRETRTRVKPSTRVFRPTPIAPKTQNPRPHPRRPGTSPTSAPTSAARPLICYSEFLERSPNPATKLISDFFKGMAAGRPFAGDLVAWRVRFSATLCLK